MNEMVLATGFMGGLGLLFGGVLAAAHRVFHVEEDPRIEQSLLTFGANTI